MKTYIFEVTLPDFPNVSRKIEMREDQTLAILHEAIQDAYDFDDDHMYSFFMSGKAWDSKTEYSLPDEEFDFLPTDNFSEAEEFVDILEKLRTFFNKEDKLDALNAPPELADLSEFLENTEDNIERNVLTTTLADLNLKKRKRFLYLFDYGDEWHFNIKVQDIGVASDDAHGYPRIFDEVGEAPPQYPNYDDELLYSPFDPRWQEMCLPEEDAIDFLGLYYELLYFAGQERGLIRKKMAFITFKNSGLTTIAKCREAIYEPTPIFETFLEHKGTKISEKQKAEVEALKRFIKDTFIVITHNLDLRGTIFIETNSVNGKGYIVKGISSGLNEIMPPPPAIVKTVLLPYRGYLICDGLLADALLVGPNMQSEYWERYTALIESDELIKEL